MPKKTKNHTVSSTPHIITEFAEYLKKHIRADELAHWEREARKKNKSLLYILEQTLRDFWRIKDKDYELKERNK